VGLENVAHTPAKVLSHGDQRLLEVGIALAVRPRLLFWMNPPPGMNPVERVKSSRKYQTSLSRRKNNFRYRRARHGYVFSLSDRVVVLHHGDIIADGTSDEIQDSKQVREVYLGEEVME